MKRILVKSNIIILLCTLASCTIFKNKNPKRLNFLKNESHKTYVINIFSEIRLKENGDIYLKASPDMHKTVKLYTDGSDKKSKTVIPNDSYEVHKKIVFKGYTITDGPSARGDYKTYIVKRKKDRCKYKFIYERVTYSKGRVFNNIKNNIVLLYEVNTNLRFLCVRDRSGILFCPPKGKKDTADSLPRRETP